MFPRRSPPRAARQQESDKDEEKNVEVQKKRSAEYATASSTKETKKAKTAAASSKENKGKETRLAAGGAATTKRKQKSLFDFFGASKKSKKKLPEVSKEKTDKKETGGSPSLENKPPAETKKGDDDDSISDTADQKPAASTKKRPAQATRKVSKSVKKQNSNGIATIGYDKQPYTGGDDLPVISEPQAMFDDMVKQNLVKDSKGASSLSNLLKKLQNRPLRVATMCSGTESPVLALDMLQKSIQDACRDHPDKFAEVLGRDDDEDDKLDKIFQLEHVFSCEIEPYKQAYIERNFHPPILFRDIRELGQEKAYTAYGALVDVPNTPGCVDILIAGTSCVDYSNLNNQKKMIEERGESGATFFGMINWIEKAQPKIVIIENVYGAPWAQKVQIFEKRGYSATFVRLDTKDFYIPHTRQRGYLFAVRRTERTKPGLVQPDGRPKKWEKLVAQFKRPASASLDAFMLANDDPRVLRGRARLTAESCSSDGDRAGRTDWTKCETRHQAARSLEELGDKRPLTAWSDSAATKMPGFAWNEWVGAQVHRIHDLLDINTLRLAQANIDATHKTMVFNLSQNVDRDTLGRLGLCQCLTPTGVPYVSNRGGPLIGEELLALQGIPVDDLLLTKETEDNLKDLAGNAMSTTVVGACILSALLQGYAALDPGEQKSACKVMPSLVPRSLIPVSEVSISEGFGNYENERMDLSPKLLNISEWGSLFDDASSSARMCISEGAEEACPLESLVVCEDCGHTSSKKHAFPPRMFEQHRFVELGRQKQRMQPASFRKKLMEILPMRVQISGFELDTLDAPDAVDSELWRQWKLAVQSTVASAGGSVREFRFTEITRTHIWTAFFLNQDQARLEARVSKTGISWLLFAKLPSKKGLLKTLLRRPIARMDGSATTCQREQALSLLDGVWRLCLPVTSTVSLSMEGVGEKVPSWRKSLGLQGDFVSEYEYETIRVKLDDSSASEHGEVKTEIEGDYKLLSKCGGACGSLRKKVSGPGGMFFFLASGRKTLSNDDSYVFSRECHRVAYGDYREDILQLDPKLQFRPFFVDNGTSNKQYKESTLALVPGKWVVAETVKIEPFSHNRACEMIVSRPSSSLSIVSHSEAWKTSPKLLSCTVQISRDENIFERCHKTGGGPTEINLQKAKKVLKEIAFATSRLSIPRLFVGGRWQALSQSGMVAAADNCDCVCKKCSPPKPEVKWTLVSKGNKTTFVPVEDGREAAVYERSLKARPHPWIVHLSMPSDRDADESMSPLTVSIGLNAVSITQRAFGLFPAGSLRRKLMTDLATGESSHCTFDWRVVPHVEKSLGDFPKLTFTSNKRDAEAKQPPGFIKFKLRKEQLRSLTWMLQQESAVEPFLEEEVAEAVLPSLNWRAEGRVRRPVLVRGGIIADEVGYGKTAITLGLIDSAPEPPTDVQSGFINTNATLVVVPKHLMGQWPAEAVKFLGTKKKVHTIKDMSSLNKLTVRDFQNADIVVVSFAVLNNEKYFSRLARLAGVNPASFPSGGKGGRHFAAVYNECLNALPERVTQIVNDCENAYTSIEEASQAHNTKQADGSLRLDGKKTVYKNGKPASHVAASTYKTPASERDPWGLSKSAVKKNYNAMTSPPLEAFFWARVVVDEFTYLTDKSREIVLRVVEKLNSSYRWCLSGTPKHGNFNDICLLADLLGVHLGVDEVLPGVKINKKWLADKETTGLESLSHYLESRSMQWHERRHALAQTFLDRFVRQNVAELDEIPFKEHEIVVQLPPAERAIYLELETHLKSLDMNNKNAQKSKKKSSGDRESRMQKILQDSETGEEALLKCCSHFSMSSGHSTALAAMDAIIDLRAAEEMNLEGEMISSLVSAFRQREAVLQYQPNWKSVTMTGKGEIQDALGVYLVEAEANKSVPHGADEEINDRIKVIVQKAKEMLKDNTTKTVEGDSDADDGEPSTKKRKKSSKQKAVDEETLFVMKQQLRNHMHSVRALAKELTGRVRSLRYIQCIRKLQKNEANCACSVCKRQELKVEDMGVLSCCGHSGCLRCLRAQAGQGHCIDSLCTARVSGAHVVSADKLGSTLDGSSSGQYGRKLSAVVSKVKELIEQSGDRVIVFCQFDDLKDKVLEALAASGVHALEVKGTVQKQISTISIFQKDKPAKNDPRVLLLKMDDEQSAGLNLTNLNHAVFVHPLLAGSQQEFDAYETQAVGRIRRFGQRKVVHVWRFLAEDTIDTEIYAQRRTVTPSEVVE